MQLTLTGDEVQQYFDLKSDLEYYKQKSQELEEELDMLREKEYRESTGMDPIAELAKLTGIKPMDAGTLELTFGTILSRWSENYTADGSQMNKAWTELEERALRLCVGKQHPAASVSYLSQMLGRTVQAINSKAHELGFNIKNDHIINKNPVGTV